MYRIFLDKFAAVPEKIDYKPLCSMEEAREVELRNLHDYLVKHLEKIAKTLSSYRNDNLIEPLCIILGELGKDKDNNNKKDK